MIEQYLSFASNIAAHVGARIAKEMEEISKVHVSQKSPRDLVTEIDVWSEKTIVDAINSKWPSHIVVGEETHKALTAQKSLTLEELSMGENVWIVDPLDGTTNFVNAIPQVSVSIGLLQNGRRTMGVVYDVARKELFSAALGKGAFLNEKKICVSSKQRLEDSVIATGFPSDRTQRWERYRPAYETFIVQARAIRRFGSAALDQCWVACGRFDGFFEYSLKPWDLAAGSLIVEEAGGIVSNFSPSATASEFSIFGDSFLAAGAQLYPRMIRESQAAYRFAQV